MSYKISDYCNYPMWCHYCHSELTDEDVDDCGIWYLNPDGSKAPGGNACDKCLHGEPGRKHRILYGWGER